MDIASLVLGIIGIILSFIPFCNFFALPLVIVGLILGIISTVKKTKENLPKGMAITGSILSGLGLIISILWIVYFYFVGTNV